MSPPNDAQAAEIDPTAEDLILATEDSGPAVGQPASRLSPVVTVTAFAAAAVVLFLILDSRRVEHAQPGAISTGMQAEQASWSPPPLALPVTQISTEGPGPFAGLPTLANAPPSVAQAASAPASTQPVTGRLSASDLAQRRHAPSVVVDLGGAPREVVLAQAGASSGATIGGAAGASAGGPAGQRSALSDSEQFAKRVGDEEPERARAVSMRDLRATAPQGTIIPGVLETAINSDLPGFTRAMVSRDVLSFDGKAVLIPRGSRIIGQYKSAVSLGQSRAFIIWTRVIRPDGVSIQIGSPGTDELGRGGLAGDVDRHFFRRFSGSILLSVLNAGVASVAKTPSTQISIGSPGAAAGLANSALQGDAIPPTIRVAQGEAINIFAARDLDFSAVEPVK
jgi:type IV secretory pathway VirB10-like protein